MEYQHCDPFCSKAVIASEKGQDLLFHTGGSKKRTTNWGLCPTHAAQWPRTTLQSYLQDVQDIGVSGTQRSLIQASAASVTVVNTAQELQDAVAGGSRYIEIRSHLDLRTAEPIYDSYMLFIPLDVTEEVTWVCVEYLVLTCTVCFT